MDLTNVYLQYTHHTYTNQLPFSSWLYSTFPLPWTENTAQGAKLGTLTNSRGLGQSVRIYCRGGETHLQQQAHWVQTNPGQSLGLMTLLRQQAYLCSWGWAVLSTQIQVAYCFVFELISSLAHQCPHHGQLGTVKWRPAANVFPEFTPMLQTCQLTEE